MAGWPVLARRVEAQAVADSGSTDPSAWPTCGYSKGELDPGVSALWEGIAWKAVTSARRNGVSPDLQRWGGAVLAAADRVDARHAQVPA